MSRPTRQLLWMIVGLLAAGFLTGWLWDTILTAFWHNAPLNSFIMAVLAIGAIYLFWQVIRLNADITWAENFRTGQRVSTTHPRLLAPMAAMLKDRSSGKLSLSASATRSLLDGIASRQDESREISRYLISLLIFLGLLGTFWGLLGTINAVAVAIRDMKVSAGGDPASMFESLKASLEGPLNGMGIAFSASLFGLSGSLLLGYLELQAGQAQNRFFNELEDWLSGQTKLSSGGGTTIDGDQPVPAYIQALLEQTAESLGELQRTIARSEDNRHSANANFKALADQIMMLTDQLRSEQQVTTRLADSQSEMRGVMQKLGDLAGSGGFGLDANSRGHLRNIDGLLNRLAEDLSQGRTIAVQDLRSEIKVLTRTIAVAAGLERNPPQ